MTEPVLPSLIDANPDYVAAKIAEIRSIAEKNRIDAETSKMKGLAEEMKLREEARKFAAEADQAQLVTAKYQIDYDRENHKRQKELSSDEFYHRYMFDEGVAEPSVRQCITQLSEWERMAGSEKLVIEMVIDSPGGSIFDGFHLIDYIRSMQSHGHVINTTALGMSASMAGVLLQVGTTRRMAANSMLLIHEAQFHAYGSYGNVMDEVEMVRKLHEKILSLYATRAQQAKGDAAMTKAQLAKRWQRTDFWLDAIESEKYGFVDEIV
jgi:ATP-dependent protease ClpP protease subunit